MIKIAYVINAIYTNTGGTEKQLLMLLENLDRNKYSPTLCVLRTSEWVETKFDLCPVYTVGIESLLHPKSIISFLKFCRFLKSEKFHIVQTHFSDANKIGIIAAKISGVGRIISTRRNQWYLSNYFEMINLKLLNKFVDRLVPNSLSTAELVVSREGVPRRKVTVINNACDLGSFKPLDLNTRIQSRRALDIPDNALVVGIVASLREIKGIDVFIRAARKVKDRYPEALFLIIGTNVSYGIEERKLHMLSKQLNLVDSMHFLGERHDIPQLLAAFDIAVLTSRSEGFSNSLVEYIAAGLPVVTTDVGGAREAVTEGVNGYIVSVNDYEAVSNAIIRIAEGSINTDDIFRKQQEAHQKFSLRDIIESYENLYNELVYS